MMNDANDGEDNVRERLYYLLRLWNQSIIASRQLSSSDFPLPRVPTVINTNLSYRAQSGGPYLATDGRNFHGNDAELA